MDSKKDWYIKLLEKLRKIQSGELQLNDYINEVSEKIDKLSTLPIQESKFPLKLSELRLEKGDYFSDMTNNFIFIEYGMMNTIVRAKCAETGEPFNFAANARGFVNGIVNNTEINSISFEYGRLNGSMSEMGKRNNMISRRKNQ